MDLVRLEIIEGRVGLVEIRLRECQHDGDTPAAGILQRERLELAIVFDQYAFLFGGHVVHELPVVEPVSLDEYSQQYRRLAAQLRDQIEDIRPILLGLLEALAETILAVGAAAEACNEQGLGHVLPVEREIISDDLRLRNRLAQLFVGAEVLDDVTRLPSIPLVNHDVDGLILLDEV